jgi:hypothetical protein
MDPKLIEYLKSKNIKYTYEEKYNDIDMIFINVYIENSKYFITNLNQHDDIPLPIFFNSGLYNLTVDELIEKIDEYEYPYDLRPDDIDDLLKSIVLLRKENEQLKNMLNYRPNGDGYEKSKSNYTHLINS